MWFGLRACWRLAPHATGLLKTLTHTVFPARVGLIAAVADAAIASTQVLTDAILADVGVQAALVDICKQKNIISVVLWRDLGCLV